MRQCFRIEENRFLYLLRCDGRIPHLDNMNRFVRLLLEISVDFLDLTSLFAQSRSVLFRQSGTAAKIDAVGSGSRTADDIGVLVVKANRLLVLTLP
jgi:hypothetical protein